MKNRIILITLASLMALTGCKQKPVEDKSASFDWDNNDKREYIIDYTVHFTADHDSTIQVTATGNYGTVKVAQVESKNLLDADGNYVVEPQKAQIGMVAAGFHTRSRRFGFCNMMCRK